MILLTSPPVLKSTSHQRIHLHRLHPTERVPEAVIKRQSVISPRFTTPPVTSRSPITYHLHHSNGLIQIPPQQLDNSLSKVERRQLFLPSTFLVGEVASQFLRQPPYRHLLKKKRTQRAPLSFLDWKHLHH
jgi:hypothetical protein